MEPYRNQESPERRDLSAGRKAPRRTRSTARRTPLKKKDLTKYLTLDYVRRALAVIDHRLEKKDAQTAKYVLEMYFGKASVAHLHNKAAALEKKPKKPNLRLTTEFFDKLAQKYFPKPDIDDSGSGEQKPVG